jgi:hypothetical protein
MWREHKKTISIHFELVAPLVSGGLALKGVESALYIARAFLPDGAEVGIGFVSAAKEAGVHRIVFSSVIHPMLAALQNHFAKGSVENAILESGMEYTFLQSEHYCLLQLGLGHCSQIQTKSATPNRGTSSLCREAKRGNRYALACCI